MKKISILFFPPLRKVEPKILLVEVEVEVPPLTKVEPKILHHFLKSGKLKLKLKLKILTKKMSIALAPPFLKVEKIKLKYFSTVLGYAIKCSKSVTNLITTRKQECQSLSMPKTLSKSHARRLVVDACLSPAKDYRYPLNWPLTIL